MDVQTLNKKFQKELLSGITSLVLLSTLGQSNEPMYGYQIAKSLEPGEVDPIIKQGALYPVLRSLERSGLLSSSVEPSVSGPPRKYYSITSFNFAFGLDLGLYSFGNMFDCETLVFHKLRVKPDVNCLS